MKLSKEQTNSWKNNSYVLISGLYSKNIGILEKWVDEVASWPRDDSRWFTNYEMNNPDQIARREFFVPHHKGLSSLLQGKEIIDTIEQLMGENPLLYKERINFKYPGCGANGAHQDGSAFDSTKSPYVSVSIAIDPATLENGCLELAENWKLDSPTILPMEAPFPDKPYYTQLKSDVEASLNWKPIIMDPGDAVLFSSGIPHRSAANTSNVARRILYAVYSPESEGKDLRQKYLEKKRLNQNDPQYFIGNPHALVKKNQLKTNCSLK